MGCPIKSVGKDWKTLDTALIAFKTPISQKHDALLAEQDRFYVKHLIDEMTNQGISLKHVVDLTENNVYYSPANFRTHKVKYHKFSVSGKNAPSQSQCEEFCALVEEIAPELDNNEYIGVHCTGGQNRTGFLICYYLLWKFPYLQVRHALADFEEARGFGINKPEWIDALHEYFAPAPAAGGKKKKKTK